MTEILRIIYKANGLGIWLWVRDNAIKFKSPDNIDASEVMMELKENKNEILNVLQSNGIHGDRSIQPVL
jgi:hypothetical protein